MDTAERISAADRMLLSRLNAELAHATKLQAFVSEHFQAVYGLQTGDRVDDDGAIVRRAASDDEPTPLRAAEA